MSEPKANVSGLTVSGLCTGYTHVPVLHDVSLEVRPGEIVGLLGTNGAGKSTLLRAVSGAVSAWSGSMELDGRRLNGLPPWRRVGLGLAHVLEGRHVFNGMTVRENLEVAAVSTRRRSDFAEEFALFPILAQRQSQRAGNLSGGEQQMLAIARALVTRPAVLLVDEMSAGLAPVVTETLIAGLQQVNERGAALLLVEQSPRLIAHLVDRLYLLEQGRIVRSGTVDEVGGADAIAELYLGVK